MIKNEYSCTNEELSHVLKDLKNNREFGSVFQFWISQTLSELKKEFQVEYGESALETMIDYDRLHKLAIKIVNRISQ